MDRESFLAEPRIAVLSTADADGAAYLSSIWFEFSGGAFLMPTGGGTRKVRNARERPGASVLVDERAGGFRGVAARGRLEVIEGDEALAINDRIHRRYVTDAGMERPDLGVLLEAGDNVTLRLVPERWHDWDLGPVFGDRLDDPDLAHPLSP